MRNKPLFHDLRRVKGVITPEGETLTLKTCEACEGEFLGNKFQTKCAACRLTKRRRSRQFWRLSAGQIVFRCTQRAPVALSITSSSTSPPMSGIPASMSTAQVARPVVTRVIRHQRQIGIAAFMVREIRSALLLRRATNMQPQIRTSSIPYPTSATITTTRPKPEFHAVRQPKFGATGACLNISAWAES